MAKKSKILLVEDDKKFGDSLKRLFDKEGLECILAEKPQTAISFCKIHTFDAAIIDCMLPQMNGVELALKVKEFFGDSINIYLMSGIYKDRNFTVSALKRTGAQSFLIKPFDIAALITQIKSSIKPSDDEPVLSENPIKNLFFQSNLTQNMVVAAVEKANVINGQELPVIINYLLSFRTQGALKLTHEDKEITLHFTDEGLSLPILPCSAQQLRPLIIAKECIPQEDLMNLNSVDLQLKRLTDLNYISPHYADEIYKEFALDTLSLFAKNLEVKVEFTNGSTPPLPISLQAKELDTLIYDWINTTDINWIKTYYLAYNEHVIKKLSASQNKIQLFPLVSGNKNIFSVMLQNITIEEVLSQANNEEVSHKLLHLMLVFREFFIAGKTNTANHAIQIERLKKIHESMDHQNAFERLGLKENASDQEIKRVYTEMSQTLHPDKLKDAPQELAVISAKVYDKIQDAYNSIKNSDKRNDYLKIMEVKKMEQITKAQRLIDEAVNHMIRGDYKSAETPIHMAVEITPYFPRTKLSLTWLNLKLKKLTPQDALKNILSLPNEEKDTALYMHVKGLCHLAINETDKALQSFKNALAKDSNFVAARREMSLITTDEKKQSVNILNADLKDVVGMFFSKKNKK